jgi:hypothetical protein
MFRQNRKEPEIDDSDFMPMLKTCINTVVESCREAAFPETEIKIVHDALYQHALDDYVK